MDEPYGHHDDDARIVGSVAALGGWMSPDQGMRLAAAARRCPVTGRIVEIGSFQGKSMVVLASASPVGVELIAIDPHAGNDRGPQQIDGFDAEAQADLEAFEANLSDAGVRDRVRHVRAFSDRAHGEVQGPINVLYIDGAHRFGPARSDIRDWGARVAPGGTLLIHDAFSSIGVTAAILVELALATDYRYIGRSRSLVEYRREPVLGLSGRGRNLGRQLASLPWFARNLALKVALTLGAGKVWRRFGGTEPEWPY